MIYDTLRHLSPAGRFFFAPVGFYEPARPVGCLFMLQPPAMKERMEGLKGGGGEEGREGRKDPEDGADGRTLD